tara:strand:+ start:1853 stop:2551 length:699 start_codon:yes stop_codon:yes gene_type:complete
MAFADPPFNIGHKYAEFEDNIAESELYSFTNRWVVPLWETLDTGGVMLIYHPVEMQRFVWSTLNIYDISKYHENTIIAHFNFGQYRDTDFINAHCQCVVIRKPGERKFYPDDIRIPSERLKMGDKRVLKAKNKGMRVPGNVIESPRVQGNNSERWDMSHGALVDHPNQLPLSFLKTLVSAYTREGDSVIEPFAGSGGLALACDRMGRNYVGCELGEKTAESARKRAREGYWS